MSGSLDRVHSDWDLDIPARPNVLWLSCYQHAYHRYLDARLFQNLFPSQDPAAFEDATLGDPVTKYLAYCLGV